MELLMIDGCTNDILEVDGVDMYDCSENELRNTVHGVIDRITYSQLIDILSIMIGDFGNGEYSDRCETCGDSSYTSKLTLEDTMVDEN